MTDTQTYWIVAKISKWENLRFSDFPVEVRLQAPDGQAGFIPVFYNRDDAVKFAGDEKYVMEIREVPK